MQKILSIIFLFVVMMVTLGGRGDIFAQTATPSATPTTVVTQYDDYTSTTSSTTKGGVDTSTTSTTLPEELPVTGAYDSLFFMVLGGVMLIGLAGVVRVKLVESLEN